MRILLSCVRIFRPNPLCTCHLPGRPTRYTYLGAMEGGPSGEPRFVGVTKYDLSKVSCALKLWHVHLQRRRECGRAAVAACIDK